MAGQDRAVVIDGEEQRALGMKLPVHRNGADQGGNALGLSLQHRIVETLLGTGGEQGH